LENVVDKNGMKGGLIAVMPFETSNKDGLLLKFIYQPVLARNAARPITLVGMFQWFRFSQTFKWFSADISQ
jgi:hypothetical protein